MGGTLLSEPHLSIEGQSAWDWLAGALAELARLPNVRLMTRTTAIGYYHQNMVGLCQRVTDHLATPPKDAPRERLWRVRAGQVVLAQGAIEKPLVFDGNDRPGVMLSGAAQTFLHRFGVKVGARAVVMTTHDSAWHTAFDLAEAGIAVAAIVDLRNDVAPALVQRAAALGIEALTGHTVTTTSGRLRVSSVRVGKVSGNRVGAVRRIACDTLLMCGGWTPSLHLFSHTKGSLRWDADQGAFLPDRKTEECQIAGAGRGLWGVAVALEDGAKAGALAASAIGRKAGAGTFAVEGDRPGRGIVVKELPTDLNPSRAKAFTDFQNDVTAKDIRLAVREGYGAIEHVKRYTTAGMGIDQGKTGNLNVVGAVAAAQGLRMEDVGQTTMRSPWTPVEFGALVGARGGPVFLPYRHTPLTSWHIAHGAFMFEAGARWRRPLYYPRAGETMNEAVQREARAVREAVAMYDGSPLGKFEIRGPDALALLQMLYTNDFSTLERGMGRYGIMLSDDGIVLDDGVSFKLDEGHYLMSTSTGNADEVWRHIQHFLQVERPQWRVRLANLTAVWGNATVCGPRARELLAALDTDIDLSNEAFPFMGLREGRVAGIPARVARVSFTGELSFEINVRARDLPALWQRAFDAGQAMGLSLVGSETNHVLRVEKGFLSLGHEVDATADPHDLGMGWAMSRKKADYLGKRAVEIRRAGTTRRRELVGLLPLDPTRLLVEGAPLTPGGRREASEGFVSACVWSVVHGRSVALGLLADGRRRMDETVHVRMKDEVVPVRVVAPCFHDPQGQRMRS